MLALLAGAAWYGIRAWRIRAGKEEATRALAAYDFPEARRLLDACLERAPHDLEALLLAAQAARRDDRLDEAQKHLDAYRSLVDVVPPEGTLQTTLLLVRRGQVKKHVHAFIEQIEIRHPAREQMLEALALGSVQVYRLDEGSFWTRQLLDRFPRNPIGRLLDARTHETLRRRERSLAITRKLLEDFPEHDAARLYLAGLLTKTHQYEEAESLYRELHRRRPADLAPLFGLTLVLLKTERAEDACPLLRKMEAEHGDSPLALLECARFALQENQLEEAEALLRRGLKVAPHDHELHYSLAQCLERLGRTAEARPHLDRFRKIEADMKLLDEAFQATIKTPADPAPRLEAGRICLRNGQTAEGLRWLYGVLDLVPSHQGAHRLLADHYEAAGEAALAEQHRRLGR